MSELLEKINKPNDIKNIDKKDYPKLAEEIREFLIDSVSKTGGHLASNLGTVDLTIALHAVLDFPKDKIVWDVGHQAYTHKILTGRKDEFESLRQLNGLSGFPKRHESLCDSFDTGHSSTSISAALGMATAAKLNETDEKIVASHDSGNTGIPYRIPGPVQPEYVQCGLPVLLLSPCQLFFRSLVYL